MSEWYDHEATLTAVLATLRLTEADIDVELLGEQIPAAAAAIDFYLDRFEDDPLPGPPPPPAVQTALEATTISIYHRDAITATLGAGISTLVRVGAVGADQFDPLADVYVELTPHKQQWGVA